MRLLSPADYRTMTWKNGLGVTTELARHPENPAGGLDRFHWRLSIAQVASSGPFSHFPGCDRLLALIEGNGVVLKLADGVEISVRAGSGFHAFSGDADVTGVLADGPIRDFNVIVDRARVDATARMLSVDAPMEIAPQGPKSYRAVHALEGELRLEGPGGRAFLPAGWTLVLAPLESCVLAGAGARIVLVSLRETAAAPIAETRTAAP
jgi:environmental stress-induced protein Ves